MVITYSKGEDQPRKVANPARGQLNRENDFSPLFAYDSITVSSAWELTSVSIRYSQGNGVNTSLSRLMYCTHD